MVKKKTEEIPFELINLFIRIGEEREHFKNTGIPRCLHCKKDFKKLTGDEYHSSWTHDCNCVTKKLIMSIG